MHLKPKAPVSKLTKLLRNEKDNDKNVRGGNRGGRDQFSWDKIKSMKFKERENYLGYTEKIGELNNRKWKKNNWFLNVKKNKINKKDYIKEIEEEKRKEKERMDKYLGLKPIINEEKQLPLLSYKKVTEFTEKIKNKGIISDKSHYENYNGLGYNNTNKNNNEKIINKKIHK